MPTIKRPLWLTILLLTGLCLTSCDQSFNSKDSSDTTVELEAVVAQQSAEIQWYDGSIEQAFALAEVENKPLFLYWGAIWCPPCEQIKATVFKHPAFLAKTELFVPVYLDGDTERAQQWGEKFAVAGYPTMIVFSPSGDEVTRIPGWIDSTQYINVLQLALDDLTSTKDLLRQALSNPASVKPEAFTRLAFYSWEQANLPRDLPMNAATFRGLADAAQVAGNTLAWSRLVLHSLYADLVALDQEGIELSQAEQAQAHRDLATILTMPDLVLANSDYGLLYFEEFITLLSDGDSERDMLATLWIAAMQNIRAAPQLSGAEHIASWYPQIQNFWLNNPEADQLPVNLEQDVVTFIDMIDSNTRGDARQNVINSAYQVLDYAGRADLARTLLLTEINQSHAPYYFMSSLGGLEDKAGNPAEAVNWHRRAWDGARGEATRFQWGYQYVESLIRLTPENGAEIVATSQNLLDEFAVRENILTGRNFERLDMLLSRLEEWQEASELEADAKTGLQDFLTSVDSLCTNTDSASESSEPCQQMRSLHF
jgi:thioredoxin-related protein